MKTLIILAFMVFSLQALASEQTVSTKLMESDSPFHVYAPKLKIDTNDIGRAWVEVKIAYEDIEDMYNETVKIKVPNLRHNLDTGEIMLNDVICATVTKKLRRRLLRSPVYKTKVIETGACHFDAKAMTKEVTIDTGFDLRETSAYFLDLNYSF